MDAMSRKLTLMLNTMESHRLHVVLAPLNPNRRGWNEHGCKRVIADRNVDWYRRLCLAFPSTRKRVHRKHDTLIKRQHTLAALNRMLRGNLKGRYAERILQILPGVKL